MEDDNIIEDWMNDDQSFEFGGTCRICGSNVDLRRESDKDPEWRCENSQCDYNEWEEALNEPAWVE